MKWEDLSLRDKAAYIRVGVANGLSDIELIKGKFNEFQKGGKISDKEYYDRMEADSKVNSKTWGISEDEAFLHMLNDNSYDYRGWYNDPLSKSNNYNAETHYPDKYKTVYHDTFSDKSIYSGKINKDYNPTGKIGGHWYGDIFVPRKDYK